MRKSLRLFFCSTIATLLFGLAPPADAAVDPAAAVVKVRTVCTDRGN